MALRQQLFGNQGDWLEHTLAHAGDTLPETEGRLPDGSRIRRRALGVLELTPARAEANANQEALIVSAGVHGNETAPIEVLNGLLEELLEGHSKGIVAGRQRVAGKSSTCSSCRQLEPPHRSTTKTGPGL